MAALCCISPDTDSNHSYLDQPNTIHHSMASTDGKDPTKRKLLPRSIGITHLDRDNEIHPSGFGSDREAMREFRQIFQLRYSAPTTPSPGLNEGKTSSFTRRPKDSPNSLVARLRRRLSKDSALKTESSSSKVNEGSERDKTSSRRSRLVKRKSRDVKSVLTSHRPLALFIKEKKPGVELDLLSNVATDGGNKQDDYDTDAHLLADQKLLDKINNPSSSASTTRSFTFNKGKGREVAGGNSLTENKQQGLRKPSSSHAPRSPSSTLVSLKPNSLQCSDTDPAITYQNLINPVPVFEASEPNFSQPDICVKISLEAPRLSPEHSFAQAVGSDEPLLLPQSATRRYMSTNTSQDSEIGLTVAALVDGLPSFGLEQDSDISRYQSISSQFYSTCASRLTKPQNQQTRITELSEEATPVFRVPQEEDIIGSEQGLETGADQPNQGSGSENQPSAPLGATWNNLSDSNNVNNHKRGVSSSGSSLHLHKMRISQHLRSLSSLSDVSSKTAPTVSCCLPPRESLTLELKSSNVPEGIFKNEERDAMQNAVESYEPRSQISTTVAPLESLFDSSRSDQSKVGLFSSLDDTIERATTNLMSDYNRNSFENIPNTNMQEKPSQANTVIETRLHEGEVSRKTNDSTSRAVSHNQENSEVHATPPIHEHEMGKPDISLNESTKQESHALSSHQGSCYDGPAEPFRKTAPAVDAHSSSMGGNYNEAAAMWEKALRTHQHQLFESKHTDHGNRFSLSGPSSSSRKASDASTCDPLDVGDRLGRKSSEAVKIELKRINTEHSFDRLAIPGQQSKPRNQSLSPSIATDFGEYVRKNERKRSASRQGKGSDSHQAGEDVTALKKKDEDFAVPSSNMVIPEIKVTDPDSVSPKFESRLARIRPVSTLRAWSRYPSHTRGERSLSAGILDNVITRDFALIDCSSTHINCMESERDSSELERVNKRKRAKARSMMLKRKLLDLPALFKSRSMVGFRKSERGHRTSIAPGGKLDYPELELMAPRGPRIPLPIDTSNFPPSADIESLENVARDGHVNVADDKGKDTTAECQDRLEKERHNDRARVVSSEYSSRKSDENEVNCEIGSLNAAISKADGRIKQISKPDGGNKQADEIDSKLPSTTEHDTAVVDQKLAVDAYGADRRRMRRSTQDLCQRMDTEEREFLEGLREE